MENGRRKRIEQVEEMPVYQAFFGLALEVEKATKRDASDFRWLRDQSLRSPESVRANLAEGFYSQYSTEYLHALYRSRREARETMTHLRYAMSVGQLAGPALVMKYAESLKQ